MELGQRLRDIRLARQISIQRVAKQAGLSRNYLSQIEGGTANPSVGTLKKVAAALDVPLGSLFSHDGASPGGGGDDSDSLVPHRPTAEVVRHDRRKVIAWPDSHGKTFLLTPDLQRSLEVTMDEDVPGHVMETGAYTHEGEEFGIVLEGTYEVTVGGETYVLEPGDTIYYQSQLAHSQRLIGETPGRTIWVITPPSF